MTEPRRRGRRKPGFDRSFSGEVFAPAYLTRKIPHYALLEEEQLQQIENQSDWLLSHIGIEFRGDPEALDLFKQAGVDVKGERVKFEPGQAQALVATAPKTFTQYSRNPARSIFLGGNNMVFAPMYGAPFVRDREQGRRYGTLEDFQNLIKLAYLSPWIHHSGGTICEPCDVPVNKRHLDMVYSHIRYSDKPYIGSITEMERALDSIELSRIVFGPEFVDQNCVVMANINVNSPLVYDRVASNAIRAYASANQAPIVVPFVLAGAMGPVSIAASIAQAHAEALAGLALGQLARPGSPAIYGNFFTTVTLRSGSPTFGMPESALAYITIGQLARRLGLPFRCGGSLSGSKVADAQAMQESSDSLWPVVLAGANFVLHAAGWLEGALTMGYEKFVLDCEHLGMMQTFINGIATEEPDFARDAYAEVPPGGHFLGCRHTLKRYKDAFFDPQLCDYRPFEQWQEDGAEDAELRAYKYWKKQLAEYEAPSIDIAVDEALREFISKRKSSMPDRWH